MSEGPSQYQISPIKKYLDLLEINSVVAVSRFRPGRGVLGLLANQFVLAVGRFRSSRWVMGLLTIKFDVAVSRFRPGRGVLGLLASQFVLAVSRSPDQPIFRPAAAQHKAQKFAPGHLAFPAERA